MVEQIVNFALLGAEWVLYLLVALSVCSVAVIVERTLFFRRRRIDHAALQVRALAAMSEDKDALGEEFANNPTMAVAVAKAALAHRHSGIDAASEAMTSAKLVAKEDYEALTVVLGTLGNNAPFIGLFGTVLGIIQAFSALQNDPTGGINAVMGATSEALVATAVGILVAIPAVVSYNIFNRLLRSHLGHSDALAHALLSAMHSKESR